MKTTWTTRTEAGASRRRGTFLVVALAFTLLAGCAPGSKKGGMHAAPEPRLTAEEQRLNVESFDVVWETIRDSHWDPEFGGLDWQAVHDELRPQVEQAQTMSQARVVMRDAIGRLKESHFGVIPRDVYEDMGAPYGEHDGETGITVRLIEGRALVTAVREDSPAADQGVRPGWQIIRIGDEGLQPVIAKIAETYDGSTLQQLMLVSALEARLAGPVGEAVAAEFLAADARPVTVEMVRAAPKGRRIRFGHLPPMYLWFETRCLDDNVGYIAFNVFLDPDNLMAKFEDAVRSYMDADGVILDLRGNPGGMGAMSMGMAGWFVERPDQPLGTMRTRRMELSFVVFPRVKTYPGLLAVLVDGCTGSTAEILTGGLQDLGRARIFGTRTAGAALPAMIEKLPNGDGFMHAVADYVSGSGRRLEGAGVVPDIEVVPTRRELLAGRDPVLDAALEWIGSHEGTAAQPGM